MNNVPILLFQSYKVILMSIAIILTFVAFVPYIRSILKGKTKPHVFSWVIWGITTFVVFLAQLSDKGGVGAWPIGISGIITMLIAGLAYTRKVDITITRTDWVFFISALSAIPFWYITSDPLWAVFILTSVDLIGFAPTFRKAYEKPFEEQLLLFNIMTLRNIIAIIALENYSITTILFPASISCACVAFTGLVWFRRIYFKKLLKSEGVIGE